jgi:hypothetical protein
MFPIYKHKERSVTSKIFPSAMGVCVPEPAATI